jgi:hypothetical protein
VRVLPESVPEELPELSALPQRIVEERMPRRPVPGQIEKPGDPGKSKKRKKTKGSRRIRAACPDLQILKLPLLDYLSQL